MKKILAVAAVLIATITNAHAWGDREQGILAGIAGTLIWQHIANSQPHYPQQPPVAVGGYPQVYPQPVPQQIPQRPPVIVVPQPQVIIVPQPQPRYHGHGHRHYNGYYQLPDPRVYNPQMY